MTLTSFEQYITQISASIVNALCKPLSEISHYSANHLGWNGSNLISYRLFKSVHISRAMLKDLGFEISSQEVVAGCQVR